MRFGLCFQDNGDRFPSPQEHLNPAFHQTDQPAGRASQSGLGANMPIFVSIQRRNGTAAALLGAALTAASPAAAHVIPIQELRQGIAMTSAQCASLPSTVWLVVQGRPFCIRYYLSTAGGTGARPVVFLEGDKLGAFNTRTGVFKPDP